MNILQIISVLLFSLIIILTIRSMVIDRRRSKAYDEYWARKNKERDAWMKDHEF